MEIGIGQRPLSYVDRLTERQAEQVDLVVVHCTELPDLATAREYGEVIHYPESRTGNSGHFYVDRDGRIEEWVPAERVAHHTRGYNPRSIGVELVNRGRFPNWFHSGHQAMTEPYSREQIAALVALLDWLGARLPALSLISGHEQLDRGLVPASDDPERQVNRKLDPGPQFPWPEVLAASSLAWYEP